jgi:hypothetical protein
MQRFLNYVAVHSIVCALRFPEEKNEASDTGFCHPCAVNTSCRGRWVPRSCWLLSFWNLRCLSASCHRVCWCVILSHAAWRRVWPTVIVTRSTVDICPLVLEHLNCRSNAARSVASVWQVFPSSVYPKPLKPAVYVRRVLKFTNSSFCLQSEFLCLIWISEQTAIISQNSINQLDIFYRGECLLRGTKRIFKYNSDMREWNHWCSNS